MVKKIIPFLILFFSLNTYAANPWDSYIDSNVSTISYYLLDEALNSYFDIHKKYHALDLGAGSGNEDIKLIAKGWDVTSIDSSARSGEVIHERAKILKGHSQFIQQDFASLHLTENYDFVMSFFALPFGNKNDLSNILRQLNQHMNRNAVFAANFFGNQHGFVIAGQAYGLTQDELMNALKLNHFKVTFFLNRQYDKPDATGAKTHWDVFDVIAVKE